MKNYQVTPSLLKGSISVPTSKSQTMRAILFGALASGKTSIHQYLSAPDTAHMIHACRLLGAKIDVAPDHLEIEGVGGNISQVEDVIQAGNSGIILRFMTAIGALSSSRVVITGDHSVCHRPMGPMLSALKQLGVLTESSHGLAPVALRGPLKGGKVTISGEDSQPISSLLIACSLAEGATELTVLNPGEKPWVELTLSWLDRMKARYKNEDFKKFYIEGGARFKGFNYTVPGDWSTAAFPIGAALITGSSLLIKNVDMSDLQGDKEIVHVLKKMGANLEIDDKAKALHVRPGGQLKGITIDINPLIDAIPILAVIACYAAGKTRIINGSVARVKECDRLHCMALELTKMGAHVTEFEDGLEIEGGALIGATINSHGDHRIAMALAIGALGAKGPSVIENVECVSKTFPNFVESFKSIGASLHGE